MPFLNDQSFAQYILEIEITAQSAPTFAAPTSPLRSIQHLLLKLMTELLLFLLKPITTTTLLFSKTKIFYAKYNLTLLWGNLRVGIIKLFYLVFNFRFSVKRFAFRLSQVQYFFRSEFGSLRVALIKAGYAIINLRYLVGPTKVGLIKLFYVVINTRFIVIHVIRTELPHLLGTIKVLIIKAFYIVFNTRFIIKHVIFSDLPHFVGTVRVLIIKLFYGVINTRFTLMHALHSIYIFVRFNPLITLVKYLPPRLCGWAKVGLIKSFYFIYNLRFPIQHNLSVFFWFNFKYTFYPLRKLYWVFIHEFNKRVLAKFSHATKN